jgi:hypothetical protein
MASMTTTNTTAAHTMTSAAILPSDFSNSTTDALRHHWTDGKLRHLLAALGDSPVVITVDTQTGHTLLGVTLVGIGRVPGYGSATLRVRHADGHVIAYTARNVGVIIPMAEASVVRGPKWEALRSYADEGSAAIRVGRTLRAAEVDAEDYGKWEATPNLDTVSVYYTPQREGAGRRWLGRVPLAALEA